jgi:subfamily B ATP-binding cassette protein MsbA
VPKTCGRVVAHDILPATRISSNTPTKKRISASSAELALDDSSARRWLFRALRQYPGRSLAVVVLSVLNSLADGLSITLLIPFLALLFGGVPALDGGLLGRTLLTISTYAGEGRELAAVSALIVSLIVFRGVVRFVEGTIASWIKGNVSKSIRLEIHENLLKVDYEFICVNDKARLLNTLDAQTWTTTEALTSYFGLFTSICMAAVFTTIMALISWQLTVLVALLFGLASVAILPLDRRMRAHGAEALKTSEDLAERSVELFDAMRMIRVFGREASAQARFGAASQRMFDVTMRDDKLGAVASSLQDVLSAVSFVIVVFFALWLGLSGAAVIGYLALLHRLQPHIRDIDGARMHLASLSAAAAAVSRLLQLPRWMPQTDGLKPERLAGSVSFDRVSFAYAGKDDEERNALDNVTFELPIGKVTGIVGWSGAGKSTLISLLFRFHDPKSGSVTVDGIPLPRLDLDWWRSQLAIAGQDAELLGGTIRENIAFGKAGATFDEIVDAAKRAAVHDFILSLPHGYDTKIGGQGALLSGGQRQRIGLARALVRRASLLVLDEATNSVDTMTEAEVLRSLDTLRGKMTIVVIAHRLSTLRTADHIVALADGRVVETGSPADLLRKRGLYAQMVELEQLAHLRDPSLHVVQAKSGLKS